MSGTQPVPADDATRRAIGPRRLIHDGLVLVGIIGAVYYWFYLLGGGDPSDARAYWLIDPSSMYAHGPMGSHNAYLYSPAFAQLIGPLATLRFDAFAAIIRGLELVALVWMAGPLTLPVMLLPPVASEINGGNINLLVAAAIVLGMRWPAAWAFVILTKVTPGVGLLWFAVRREWRAVGVALAATAAVVAVSFVFGPSAWRGWVDLLTGGGGEGTATLPYRIPLQVRLPVAIAIVVAAGLRGAKWPVPLAATLAAPALFFPTQAIAVGVLPFLRPSLGRAVDRVEARLRPGTIEQPSTDRWPAT